MSKQDARRPFLYDGAVIDNQDMKILIEHDTEMFRIEITDVGFSVYQSAPESIFSSSDFRLRPSSDTQFSRSSIISRLYFLSVRDRHFFQIGEMKKFGHGIEG